MTKCITGLNRIISQYDVLFSDIWGVLWDGQTLFSHVTETLAELQRHSKQTILITNAAKSPQWIENNLAAAGLDRHRYHAIVSSGSVCFQHLANEQTCKRVYLIGRAVDRSYLSQLNCRFVDDIDQADCIILMSLDSDHIGIDYYDALLASASKRQLPLYCANPDYRFVDRSGQSMIRAGTIAERYTTQYDGLSKYFGKPHRDIYEHCLALVPDVDKKKILAVGDSILHDIQGAKAQGIDSLLIRSGVSQDISVEECLERSGADYLAESFIW